MSQLYTRRVFLSLTGAMALAVGFAKYFHFSVMGRNPADGQCPSCKAYIQAHKHKNNLFCPNCGIDLDKRTYDLASNNGFVFGLKLRRRNRRVMAWEWAQVPFPNARLIRQSDKPAIVFSEVKT